MQIMQQIMPKITNNSREKFIDLFSLNIVILNKMSAFDFRNFNYSYFI